MDSELQLPQVLDLAPDGIVVVDGEGRIRFANQQMEALFGYQPASLLGQPIELLLPERYRRGHRAHRDAYATQPQTRPMGAGLDLWGRRRDGQVFPVEISLSPLEGVDGERRVVAIVRDVTERQHQTLLLRRQAALLNLARDAILVRDLAGAITFWNAGAERLYGWLEAEALGQVSHQFLQTQFTQPLAEIEQTVRTHGFWEGELVHRSRTGRRVVVASRWSRQRDDAGVPIGILELNTDITQQQEQATDLAQLNAELARSNRELEQFAYVASHDLQEPLRMVNSYTQLLARRYRGRLDADADEFIGYAVEGAQRMKQLIDGLLDYSRVSTRRAAAVPVACGDVFAEVMSDLQLAIEDNAASITHDPLPTAPADQVQLRQLLQNLLENALKYRSADPPQIQLAVERQAAVWCFCLHDNGIGLDPVHAERIFQPFQRLHTREEYPGTGIGLAICRRIVEQHGGQIWVESQPNQGSRFSFTWPAVS